MDQLIQASMWCLRSSRGSKLQVHTGVRDRAMLLTGSSTAYHGDNTRRLLLSDLGMRDVPMIDIGPDVKVMVRTSAWLWVWPLMLTNLICIPGTRAYF
jgi:hypothetical protein